MAGFSIVCAGSAQAVILYGAGNDTNTTNPGTGLPFDVVARVQSGVGIQDGGSGVHLGGGYMLTAAHIANSELASVTFDGTTHLSRDLSYIPQRVGTSDLKVFKLSSTPEVGAAVLSNLGLSEVDVEGSLVGWGRGRAEGEPLNTNVVEVAGGGTSLVARWGTNVPNRAISDFSYERSDGTIFTFDALETTLGNPSGGGTGDFEAAAAFRDSGSGFFQEIDGTWYLTGLTSVIFQQNPSNVTYGEDVAWNGDTSRIDGSGNYGAPFIPGPNNAGDSNVFVRISSYESEIMALIPEPSTLLLSLTSLGLLLRRSR